MRADKTSVLSFRHLLTGAIEEFLIAQDMASPHAAEALGELVVRLSRYREEGSALYPVVFLCESLDALMRHVDGCDAVPLGSGTESAETIRRALKTCALLGHNGWSMFIERRDGALRFGMFRTDHFVLRESPMEVLRRTNDPSLRAIGIVQLADSIVEMCGSTGQSSYVYLSGARTDGAPPLVVVRELLTSVARDAPASDRTDVLTFYRRVMIDVLRSPHGTLIAVLPPEVDPRSLFSDGLVLAAPVDVVEHIRAYRREPTEATRSSVQALNVLVQGMMSSDGITVLRSDGAVLAFNVFVAHPDSLDAHPGAIGGARRRTYETLAAMVGDGLAGAFYRSQDGHTECKRV